MFVAVFGTTRIVDIIVDANTNKTSGNLQSNLFTNNINNRKTLHFNSNQFNSYSFPSYKLHLLYIKSLIKKK